MTLTGAQRTLVDRARQLADVSGDDAVREYTGEADPAKAYAAAFGEAQHLLRELAIIALRQATSS